jgi:mono/diheme cytochrome c family protein
MSYRSDDSDLERSTNKWMVWGLVFMALMILIFPLYLWYEPSSRAEALEAHQESLAAQGGDMYVFNCASCHGPDGEGGIGPALNSQQFLASTVDEQIDALIAVGIPGSLMSAYSLDFGGPLTSEQIDALTAYLRSWEEDAPDNPNWRECCP